MLPFIPTISYSPPPSRPFPLPLPRLNPSSSCLPSSKTPFVSCTSPETSFAAAAPKFIGCNSLHRQAHIPKAYIRASLEACNPHQRRFVGMLREYSELTMRCRKCIVREKSRTSFERETRSKRNITLNGHNRNGQPNLYAIERFG